MYSARRRATVAGLRAATVGNRRSRETADAAAISPLPDSGARKSRAVALLVSAQFRFDQRFRMAILGIVPLILFYLLLGLNEGALADPFSPDARASAGVPLYIAVVFMPMTLHASLHYSDSWRAAWIFFATPASAARLIVAAKNIVAVWFLGGYLLLLAAIWSYLLRTHLARVLSRRRHRPARPHAAAGHGDAAAVAAVCRGTEKGGTLSAALWRAVLRQA